MPQQAYVRTKPHLNIGTIGHAGHGKTTLTAAITRVLSRRATATGNHTDNPPHNATHLARDTTLTSAHVEYETDTRHYAHTDLPGHADSVTHLLTQAARLDGAILVVSALDGVMPRTTDHVPLVRLLGVKHIVVALTKADAADPDLTDIVELEARELLSAHGYPGDVLPVIRVSGVRALHGEPRWTSSVEALLDAVDTYVPVPTRHLDAPFLLPVENVPPTTGRDTAVTGTIERGTIRRGDRVQLLNNATHTVVTSLETFGRPMTDARAGDTVTLLLRGVTRDTTGRGDIVAQPGSLAPHQTFTAQTHLLTPVASGYRPRFHIRTADITGTIDLHQPGPARPGERVALTVALDHPTPLEPGLRFAVHDGGHTLGGGTVTAPTPTDRVGADPSPPAPPPGTMAE